MYNGRIYGEFKGIKGYKLFNLQNKKFIYTRSVIFYEQIQSPKYPINLQNIPLIHYVNNREYGKEHVNNMRESLQLEELKEEEESQEVHKIKVIENIPHRNTIHTSTSIARSTIGEVDGDAREVGNGTPYPTIIHLILWGSIFFLNLEVT